MSLRRVGALLRRTERWSGPAPPQSGVRAQASRPDQHHFARHDRSLSCADVRPRFKWQPV